MSHEDGFTVVTRRRGRRRPPCGNAQHDDIVRATDPLIRAHDSPGLSSAEEIVDRERRLEDGPDTWGKLHATSRSEYLDRLRDNLEAAARVRKENAAVRRRHEVSYGANYGRRTPGGALSEAVG